MATARKRILDLAHSALPQLKKRKLNTTVSRPGNHYRYTHFLSIRIRNPQIVALGQQISDEIVEQYEQKQVDIRSSLVKASRYHISLNVLCLDTEQRLDVLCNALKWFEQFLRVNGFDDDDDIVSQTNEAFCKIMREHDLDARLKRIYEELAKNGYVDEQGLALHVKGASHFDEKVVFLDFENADDAVLQYLRILYEFVNCVCDEYDIRYDSRAWKPHCTLIKVSKMKHKERRQLMVQPSSTQGGSKTYNRHRFDCDVLSRVLEQTKLNGKLQAIVNEKANYERVQQIDLCSMRGSSEDGYYRIVRSVSIIA